MFPISLGPGDRAFEPHYSDQNPSEIVDFRGIFLFFVYYVAGFEYDNIFIIHTSFFLLTAVLISCVISTVFRLC